VTRQVFTSSGTFTPPAGVTSVGVLVVGGGGAGGAAGSRGGGGGAGAVVWNPAVTVTPGVAVTVTVGAGGARSVTGPGTGASGASSAFGALVTAPGGGGGGAGSGYPGGNGACGGGGAGHNGGNAHLGGTGSVGGNGGTGDSTGSSGNLGGGGGGGMGGPGVNAAANNAGDGGPGVLLTTFHAELTGLGVGGYVAGGGGGGQWPSTGGPGSGGTGGGGDGSDSDTWPEDGTANTGSGGGGSSSAVAPNRIGGAGGSGLVVVVYTEPVIEPSEGSFAGTHAWTGAFGGSVPNRTGVFAGTHGWTGAFAGSMPYVPGDGPLSGASTSSLTTPTTRWLKGLRASWRHSTWWHAVVPTAAGHRILNLSTGTWGPVVDSRQAVRPSVVHHDGWTGVLRGHATASRFTSYEGTYAALVTDVSVPLTSSDCDAAPMVLSRTPNGHLWAAVADGEAVRVSRSTNNGASWQAAQSVVSLTQTTGVVQLVAAGKTLVLIASENEAGGRHVRTLDQDAPSYAAGSWLSESLPGLPSGVGSDDHLSVTVSPDGRVIAVAKTQDALAAGQPVIYSLVRSRDGVWAMGVLEVGPDTGVRYTRPVVTVNGDQVVAMYGSIETPNDLSYRTADLGDPNTWGSRQTLAAGPQWSDSAVLPAADHITGAGSKWPVLAHKRDTGAVHTFWRDTIVLPTKAGAFAGTHAWDGAFTGTAPEVPPAVGAFAGTHEWAGAFAGVTPHVPGDGGSFAGTHRWAGSFAGTAPRRGSFSGTHHWTGSFGAASSDVLLPVWTDDGPAHAIPITWDGTDWIPLLPHVGTADGWVPLV
jgi:hypothetical protein